MALRTPMRMWLSTVLMILAFISSESYAVDSTVVKTSTAAPNPEGYTLYLSAPTTQVGNTRSGAMTTTSYLPKNLRCKTSAYKACVTAYIYKTNSVSVSCENSVDYTQINPSIVWDASSSKYKVVVITNVRNSDSSCDNRGIQHYYLVTCMPSTAVGLNDVGAANVLCAP